MTPSSSWAPVPEILMELVNIFKEALSPNPAAQKKVVESTAELRKNPEGIKYLAVIFADLSTEDPAIRQTVGLLLKNLIVAKVPNDRPGLCKHRVYDEPALSYVKHTILKVLYDNDVHMRQTAGTIITTICSEFGSNSYPEAFDVITQLLEQQQDMYKTVSALHTFEKIVEDTLRAMADEEMLEGPLEPGALDGNTTGAAGSHFVQISKSHFLPLILKLTGPEYHVNVRRQALSILDFYNEYHAFAYSEFAHEFFGSFWKALGIAACDNDPGVKAIVLRAMLTVFDYQSDVLLAASGPVMELLVASSRDSDTEVKLQALAFWPKLLKDSGTRNIIDGYLPTLIPILLENTVYTEQDYQSLDRAQLQDDNAEIPDEAQDVAPRFHVSRGEVDEDDDDDGQAKSAWGDAWTVRKAAALSLDSLAVSYRGRILPICLPLIEARLGNPNWEIRESGVLALGAISKGCIRELNDYIPNVLNLLVNLSRDPKPLLRSISSWCLQRFALWFCTETHRETFLPLVVKALLDRMLDRNKCVQEAAVSAFAVLEETAMGFLVPYLPDVFQVFGKAFELYQTKNMLILYDAVRTLAEAVGPALIDAHPRHYSELMLKPLFMRWNMMTPNDRYQAPALCLCMGYVAQALGTEVLAMAPTLTQKSIELISANLRENIELPIDERPGTDVAESCFDLLSFLVETLMELFKPIALEHNVMPCVVDALTRPELVSRMGLKQSAFAFIGDICVCCAEVLYPYLQILVPALASSLSATQWAVCSNASWALGQLVEKVELKAIEQYCPFVCSELIGIIKSDFKNSSVRGNACITFGRFAGAYPQFVSTILAEVTADWCKIMAAYQCDAEKIKSFKGFCAALTLNPQVAANQVVPLLECATSFVYEEGRNSGDGRSLRVAQGIESVLKDMVVWLRNLTGEQYWSMANSRLSQTAKLHLNVLVESGS